MNKKLINKRRMLVVVSDYLQKNPEKLTFVPAMGGFVNSFIEVTNQIGSTHEAQLSYSKGLTLAKEDLRQLLLAHMTDIVKRIKAYTVVTGNHALLTDANYTRSDLYKMPQNTLSDACHKIIQICGNHLTDLVDYGITQVILDETNNKLTAYTSVLPETKKVIAGRKVATQELKNKFDEADKILKKIDVLIEIISLSEPEFYQGYKNLRLIDDLRRKRQTQSKDFVIRGIALNMSTGLKQPGVKVSATGTNLSTLTDAEGAYSLLMPKEGLYTLKAELKGFAEAEEEDVEVELGSITEVDFDLEPEE